MILNSKSQKTKIRSSDSSQEINLKTKRKETEKKGREFFGGEGAFELG